VLDAPASNTHCFLSRDACVSSIQLNRPNCNKKPTSTLKNQTCRMSSFHKLIEFQQGINVLHGESCNINDFLWRDTLFLQLSLTGLFGTKGVYLHFEKPKLEEAFLSQTNSFPTGNQCS
jgi:hypothetical protein